MSNTVAIMQPYIFPYIGYFNLIEASNVFVFYDDVNYINRGWINRNRILINGSPYKFTIPLSNGSQNELIYNVKTHRFDDFKSRFLKQILQAYSKAPFLDIGYKYVSDVLSAEHSSISDIAVKSVESLYLLLGKTKRLVRSSEIFSNTKGMERADRLIEITKLLHSDSYVNAMGGMELYAKEYFSSKGVSLAFVKPILKTYPQIGVNDFAAGLSIIDVVMNNSFDKIYQYMESYEII